MGKTLGLKVSHPPNSRNDHRDQCNMGLEIDQEPQAMGKRVWT